MDLAERAAAPELRPLRRLALNASAWAVGGLGLQQAIRLASNLVLTRLLFPEAFGLMALMNVWLVGLRLMSDVGIGASIVQNRRGDDPAFLNTVWTIQIGRGAGLWLGSCALAWPLAWLYGAPELAWLLPAVGVTALIEGFNSTSLFRMNRHLALARLTLVETSSQALGVAAMVALAWAEPSVWALVWGSIASALAKLALSHLVLPGPRNRWHWEPEAARELTSFGLWILCASATGFVAGQGDRLLLGKLLPLEVLGVYSIAFFLAEAPSRIVSTLQHRVLFPVLSRIARDARERVSDAFYRARKRIELGVLPAVVALVGLGDGVVRLLYDPRYAEAGWMVQLLALRIALGVLSGPASLCLMSLGQPRYAFLTSGAQALWLFVAVPLAAWLGGLHAIVWAIALHGALALGVVMRGMAREGMLVPRRELASGARVLAALALGLALQRFDWVAIAAALRP
jgi:O-antigen/teichoic acid export membrane protein